MKIDLKTLTKELLSASGKKKIEFGIKGKKHNGLCQQIIPGYFLVSYQDTTPGKTQKDLLATTINLVKEKVADQPGRNEKSSAAFKLSQYKEGLKVLNEISSNPDISSEQQIEEALGVCTEFLGLKSGILGRVEGDKYIADKIYSVDGRFRKDQVFNLEETFSDTVYKKEKILAIEDISKTTYKIHPGRELFHIESFIGIPYYVSGEKRGTLVFSSPEPREPFDQNEFEFVKLLSKWIAFILQQQEYEKNLMSDKMMLQVFASTAPAAIAMVDEHFRYIAASDKWYSDYGLEDEYIIGKSYFEVSPDIGQDWESIFKRAMAGNVEHNDQDLIEHENGDIQWIKWEVRPWYKKLDVVGGLIMYTEDISQQKEQQLQLKIAKRKAEQASKAKEQFLSTMSHEMRTPLNAIIGMTDLMLMEDQTPQQLKHLKLLKFSGENLLVLINDILDFNKIEAGKLEFEIADFNLKKLLEKIRSSLSTLAAKKNLNFDLKYDESIPGYVKGDAVRISQVITNLINNAIKFTEKGYIALKARLIHSEEESCIVKFEIKDTGIGIPEDKLDAIFQSFEQGSTETTRKYGGSGLGLAITKRILELMDSSIKVQSTVDHGSTFYFELELPLGQAKKKIPEEMKAETVLRDDLYLLVAEDNDGNRTLINSLFNKWNVNHDFAVNGREAVEKSDSKKYDLVLMDLQMPEMDGYEATKQIRLKQGKYFTDLPIIALTASVMSNVLEKAKKVGMNGYVSKPFDPNHLKEVIASHTNGDTPDIDHVVVEEVELVEELVEEPAEIIENPGNNNIDSFPYLKSLIGNDLTALAEIIKSTVKSIVNAKNGIVHGIAEDDVKKVRAELHVLRPNLHNVELGNLTKDLPKITELTKENKDLLEKLINEIEGELTSDRLNEYIE